MIAGSVRPDSDSDSSCIPQAFLTTPHCLRLYLHGAGPRVCGSANLEPAMMKRIATLFTLALVSYPSLALAQQSEGPPQSEPAAPKVELSAGYHSSDSGKKGLYVEAEFGSRGRLFAKFSRTTGSDSYSSFGYSTNSESSDVMAMVGQRTTVGSNRASLFLQGSGGVRLSSHKGTSVVFWSGAPRITNFSRSNTNPAVELSVGATVKITDRIGVRASGGYVGLLTGGLIFLRQLSAGAVVGFGRR